MIIKNKKYEYCAMFLSVLSMYVQIIQVEDIACHV